MPSKNRMRHSRRLALFLALALGGLPALARAELPIETIRLYENGPPGPKQTRQKPAIKTLYGEPKAINVNDPTLTLFRPDPAKSIGTAVIIAPGGGFEFLSITSEGTDVARALAARGITAFVLKYRLNPMPSKVEDVRARFEQMVARQLQDPPEIRGQDRFATIGAQQAIADGAEAIQLVRENAASWGVAPDRIGLLGFSAGGMLAMHIALRHDAETRPDFVASIYGTMPAGFPVPADAPPLFLAVAADDGLFGGATTPIFRAWRGAGREVELHIFQSGGHGFGMNRRGTSSDHWCDEYLWWLEARGLLARK
jgi:dienelactone hydrolase